jgi:cysteine desulfurase family protein (TIGR01976 family)
VIDPIAVRTHFPALECGTVFFDNPGGTQICREALDRMRDYLVTMNANHGGAFGASRASDASVLAARAAVADLLGAARPGEIVFGQNMTSLTMHLSRSIARDLHEGDEIVVTRLDHDANVAPWLLIARDCGCNVRWVDFDPAACAWTADDVCRQISRQTRLVAVGYASNAVGTVNPVAEAAAAAHDVGALCFVDAVHYVPHGPIDIDALGCDFLACSAYKFFGPHTGILYGRYEVLESLTPYKVRPAANTSPDRWETGTQSFESLAGVRGAIEYLQWLGQAAGGAAAGASRRAQLVAAMQAVRSAEAATSEALAQGLRTVPGLRLYGPEDHAARVPTFAFTLKGLSPRQVCEELDREHIAAWHGNYYALEVTTRLGLEASGGMVRVGAVHYNTPAEVDLLVAALRRISSRA